jgi:hypothetical protein
MKKLPYLNNANIKSDRNYPVAFVLYLCQLFTDAAQALRGDAQVRGYMDQWYAEANGRIAFDQLPVSLYCRYMQ